MMDEMKTIRTLAIFENANRWHSTIKGLSMEDALTLSRIIDTVIEANTIIDEETKEITIDASWMKELF